VASLESFGFTATEARLYEALLRLGPSTGYAVAKAAGLARANAYPALEGLVRRGAARRSATIPARYAAFSPEALIGELSRRMRRDLDALAARLSALPRAPRSPDEPAGASNDPGFEAAVESVVQRITPLLRGLLERDVVR